MKKIISFLIVIACLSAVSCTITNKELSCSIDELFTKISAVNAEGELFAYDSQRLNDDLLITSDMYSEGYFEIPLESAGVETIAFFKATSKDNAAKIQSALDEFVNDTQTYQKDYNADNYAVACKAVTKTEGLYVYLVMSPNKDKITKVINDNLK